jgi:hypothetical protein
MRRGYVIAGTLTSSDGVTGIPGSVVATRIDSRGMLCCDGGGSSLDEHGSFEIVGLRPSKYRIELLEHAVPPGSAQVWAISGSAIVRAGRRRLRLEARMTK